MCKNLPENLYFNNSDEGDVMSNDIVVGHYNIDVDVNGKTYIKIVFETSKEGFTSIQGFDGTVTLDCSANNSGNKNESEIVFKGATDDISTNISIESDLNAFDINSSKTSATFNKDDGKISYTIEIGSTKGTRDTVSFVDKLTENTSLHNIVTYDKASLVIKREDGTIVSPDSYSASYAQNPYYAPEETLTVTGLPQLDAGQKYIVTYDVTVNDQAVADAIIDMNGYINGNVIRWTITVNPKT